MKNLIVTLLVAVVSLTVNAQRVIEKNIDYKKQPINIEIPFASEIELKTWNKSTVYIKANLTSEDGKYLDLYELDIKESDKRIDIVSKAETFLKKYQEEYKKQNPGKDRKYGSTITYSGDVIIHDGINYKFDYTIFVPEGAEVKISSINGNLNSDVINGRFTADLINGNIDIKKYQGDMKLTTINGEINVTVGDSRMTAETIHGNIYADEKLEFSSEKRVVGQHIESKNNTGASKLKLSTINGNMYLR